MTASWANVELSRIGLAMPGHCTQFLDIVMSPLVLHYTTRWFCIILRYDQQGPEMMEKV